MSDLIRRDDAMQAIADYEFPWCKDTEPVHLVYGMGTAMKIVEKIPAVDAVEVVRCGKCEYWKKRFVNSKGFVICPASGMDITADDFCSYGERREENE